MARRLALVIATYQYEDAGLRRLTAPARDAESFAAVLRDPDIAGFEVTTLINEPYHRVGEVIGDFYRDRRRDDLTLLYFTGHGLKDDDGRLYLAMANTRRDSLLFTSLPAEQIDYAMSGCVSRQKVLILDCCYSGAFPAGRLAKADTEVHALERFQGRGRTVLTASDSTQYSFEGNQLRGDAAQSVFTRYLVAGLRDGSADLDGDGDITLDELYSYVHDRVVEEMPQQRPKKQDNVEGRIIIARNINWSLPAYLRNALNSPIATDRLGALDGLDHLYRIGNDIVRDCVRDEIQHLADDDSRLVAAAAVRLRSILPQPPEHPVEQVPEVSTLDPKEVPEPRAVGATTPPARKIESSVPDATPVQPPARGSSTTAARRQQAGKPQTAPLSIASGSGPRSSEEPRWLFRVSSWLADSVGTLRKYGPASAGAGPSAPVRQKRRHRTIMLAALATVILLTAIGTVLILPRSAEDSPTSAGSAALLRGVAVHPDDSRVYVVDGFSGVLMIDTATNETIGRPITVGDDPEGVAVSPDGRHVYVTNAGSDSVSVIDTETNTTIGSPITVNDDPDDPHGPDGVAVSPDARHVYVTNFDSLYVSVIDTKTNTIVDKIVSGFAPGGVAVSPDGLRVYVTNFGSDTVSVIETETNTPVDKVNVGDAPGGVAVSPDGLRVYVTNFSSGTVSVIDTKTNTIVGTINVGGAPDGVAVSPGGLRVYVTNFSSDTVSVIDTKTNTIVGTINVGG